MFTTITVNYFYDHRYYYCHYEDYLPSFFGGVLWLEGLGLRA